MILNTIQVGGVETDGYAAYERVGGPKIIHACCWSHARRLFVDAVKLDPKDAAAMDLVKRIDELFAIDARAPERQLSHHARHELRQLESAPLLDRLSAALKAALNQCLPASATGKAIHYTLALWNKLIRFVEFPQLELSTNLAENSMRGIAIGRRNWIHFGHQNAGPKIAAIFSVIESCRRLQINPAATTWQISCPAWPAKSMRSTQTSPLRHGTRHAQPSPPGGLPCKLTILRRPRAWLEPLARAYSGA